MNPARSGPLDYIDFLVAAQKSFTCTEAARCQPESDRVPAHDAFTRLLRRQPPDTEALWRETRGLVKLEGGALVLDDTTLDKPYARKMELVTRHWSGKHRRVVSGINLLTLVWSGGQSLIPCDFRIYDKPLSGKNKNDYFRDMVEVAHGRGFRPGHVLFDSWYSSLENLKKVRSYGWTWLTQFKANRRVNPDGAGNVRVDTVEIGAEGRMVHLRGYGVGQGVPERLPKRRRGALGHQRSGHDPGGAGGAEGLGLEYRAVSPGTEAVLRGGEVPGTKGGIPAEPHRYGDPSLSALGGPSPEVRGQLV